MIWRRIKIESTKLIDIESFVPQSEIDQIYADGSYYLAPDDRVAEEAFAVIRDSMARKNMVGIGRVVLSRRERMIMLQPRGKGILATTLRYPYEVRQDAEYFRGISEIELPKEMLEIAEVIIDRKSGHFEPEKFSDRYEEAVVSLVRAKQAGQDVCGSRGAGTEQGRQYHGRAEAQPRGRRWGRDACAAPAGAEQARRCARCSGGGAQAPGTQGPLRGPRCRRG